MGWRSVLISKPAAISLEDRALVIGQDGSKARVMLEDISVLVLDTPQATLTSAALSACASAQIAVLTVDGQHLPNGVLVPHLPHSRSLKVLEAQLALGQPAKKRLWQKIVQRKIGNQASALHLVGQDGDAASLDVLVGRVRSGDSENTEARAAQKYFRSLFGSDFARGQERFFNAALNYGYAIVRAAIARTLAAFGFVTASGLFHRSEQNAFNLADDLLEPYRPFVDLHVIEKFSVEPDRDLSPGDKAMLVALLHADISMSKQDLIEGRRTLLAAIDSTVSSLSTLILHEGVADELVLPVLIREPPSVSAEDEG